MSHSTSSPITVLSRSDIFVVVSSPHAQRFRFARAGVNPAEAQQRHDVGALLEVNARAAPEETPHLGTERGGDVHGL